MGKANLYRSQVPGVKPINSPWAAAFHYWSKIAPTDPSARTICRRLHISLRKQSLDSFSGFTAPLRRLVITGEDRAPNFERLFGPEWKAAIAEEWQSIRVDLLLPAREQSTMYAQLDAGAPFRRPRFPTSDEIARARRDDGDGDGDGGARLYLNDALERLSLGSESDFEFV
jgi:hypothetical protein